jgi:hypothetical protein
LFLSGYLDLKYENLFKMKLALNTVVWGADYVDMLVQYSLPTLFSSGNFIDMPWKDDLVYQLMTTREDFESIRSTPIYQRLEKTLTVDVSFIDEFAPVDESSPTHKYNRVSMAQSVGMRRAVNLHACGGILFMYPDFIYSIGSLQTIIEKLRLGHSAVFCPIPFISQESVYDGIFTRAGYEIWTEQGREVALPPRALVKLNIENPHPVNIGFDVDSGIHGEWPGVFIWTIADEGQIIRSFHLHPIGLRLQIENPKLFMHFEVSLDDEFVSRYFQLDDNFVFIQDSDDLAMCSMRGVDEPPHTMPGSRGNVHRSARWAEEFTGIILRSFMEISFRWHYVDIAELPWGTQELRACEFAERLLYRLNVPDSVLKLEDPGSFEARMRRGKHFEHQTWRYINSLDSNV